MTTNPLLEELRKLRESSKYAIAQGTYSNLDEFKKYLHVERDVEKRLKNIITRASECAKSQLILVCGNVGDGKSHILSHLHDSLERIISQFTIHNDATESHNPNESSNDTLYRILKDFKDENIDKSSSKIILAINLGTLSKFLEEYSSDFQKLTEFVQEQHILDNEMVSFDDFDPDNHFHQINFTDYHLYSLTKDGPISTIISELLNRIVNPSEFNIIFKAYEKIKDQSEFSRCPIKYNYEFLFNYKNRELIVQLIIQAIAQNNEIISVRSVLNFIHDLIVPIRLLSIEKDQLKTMQQLSDTEFLECLIPNYMFEHSDLSNLFARLTELDPCNVRDDQTDEKLLKLQSIESPSELFTSDIQPELCRISLQHINIDSIISKDVISKYFLRLLFFQKGQHIENNDFREYITWLYYFNKGNHEYSNKLYELVENAVKKWYGDPKKGDKIVLKLGRRQTKYRVFKDFSLTAKPNIPNETTESILHQFVQEFIVCYASPTPKVQDIRITINFSLFKTLKMINQGYRPNKKDNNNFISFVQFIQEVTQEEQQKSLYIDEVNVGKPIDYKLTKNAFGGYKFELVS